jgi:hypothetical protein
MFDAHAYVEHADGRRERQHRYNDAGRDFRGAACFAAHLSVMMKIARIRQYFRDGFEIVHYQKCRASGREYERRYRKFAVQYGKFFDCHNFSFMLGYYSHIIC